MKKASEFIKLIGNTPLIKLKKLSKITGCNIYGKAEFLNPGQSIKDRAALFMINDAIEKKKLKKGGIIVEGTAGNTGIGLTLIGNSLGYKSVVVIPNTQSQEKKDLLKNSGAKLIEVPAVPYSNENNYIKYAKKVSEELDRNYEFGAYWINQFDNPINKPFKIEKYTSINGVKYSDTTAKSLMESQPDQNLRISDVFPGTLKLIETPEKLGMPSRVVGIEGNIGVRHGLAFYYFDKIVTTVEVDTLDFKISQFQTVQANSKLLHCLVQNLLNDPKYKLLTSYIFSFKKVTSTLAIYNDLAFLASVGEVTTGKGDFKRKVDVGKSTKLNSRGRLKTLGRSDKEQWDDRAKHSAVRAKPGSRAYIAQELIEGEPTELTDDIREALNLPFFYDDPLPNERLVMDPKDSLVTGNEGWTHAKDRPNFTPFTLHWDEWDRLLLRNSKAFIKKLFKQHYYSATNTPVDYDDFNSASMMIKNLKARLFPTPGAGLLPWYKRRKLRDNPMDANGNMCDGPDLLQ